MMDEIPAEIWAAAEIIQKSEPHVTTAIAKAIFAERERCTAIAERERTDQNSAALRHPENSEARGRCFRGARVADRILNDIKYP